MKHFCEKFSILRSFKFLLKSLSKEVIDFWIIIFIKIVLNYFKGQKSKFY